MRACVQVYRLLSRYLDVIDAESLAAGTGPQHPSVDNDFRSGVLLGMGVTHLLLSLLPSRIGTVMELFGYKGDRKVGLETLGRAGGWSLDLAVADPGINAEDEGVRRPIADMALLIFHLVLSSFTFDGVDIRYANKILAWNLKRFPSGEHLNVLLQTSFVLSKFIRRILPIRGRAYAALSQSAPSCD
jgi:hypothetical protein